VNDTEQTYSGRLLDVQRDSGESFADFGLSLANNYRDYFTGLGDEFNQHLAALEQESGESLQRQQNIEASDTLSLDEYLAKYYA